MLRTLTVRGRGGSLVWGYHTAARLASWTVERERDDETKPWTWRLSATLDGTADAFVLRQRPLLFSAPRRGHTGFWCWPVQTLNVTVADRAVAATLGPPVY